MEPQIHRQRRPRHRQAHQNSGQNHGVTAQPAPFGRPAGLELTPARVGVKGCPARLPVQLVQNGPDGVWVRVSRAISSSKAWMNASSWAWKRISCFFNRVPSFRKG